MSPQDTSGNKRMSDCGQQDRSSHTPTHGPSADFPFRWEKIFPADLHLDSTKIYKRIKRQPNKNRKKDFDRHLLEAIFNQYLICEHKNSRIWKGAPLPVRPPGEATAVLPEDWLHPEHKGVQQARPSHTAGAITLDCAGGGSQAEKPTPALHLAIPLPGIYLRKMKMCTKRKRLEQVFSAALFILVKA